MAKTVVLLAMPGVMLLDVSGPLDVFAQANTEVKKPFYSLRVLASHSGPIASSSGLQFIPDGLATDSMAAIDTLLVAGAPDPSSLVLPRPLVDWIRSTARKSRRVGSVCTGAFVLADAGLLKGKKVTTHWAWAESLAAQHPSVTVEVDALYVRDGKLRTSAGVTAGLDMALSLVEEDLGRDVALKVAGQLVMFYKRPGGQLQFSRKEMPPPSGRAALQELQRWISANLAVPHSVASLAKRTGMSPRHFARIFIEDVGATPGAWVETARIAAARELLERGQDSPKQVAALCGFANADTLRRTFGKHVGVTPSEYRRRHAQSNYS